MYKISVINNDFSTGSLSAILLVSCGEEICYRWEAPLAKEPELQAAKEGYERAIEALSVIKPGRVTEIPVALLKEHPRNRLIYGAINSSELQSLIKDSGYIEPLIVNRLGWVISGNRRLDAAKKLGIARVRILVSDILPQSAEEILLLVTTNVGQRKKSPLQLANEVRIWEEYYRPKAAARQSNGKVSEESKRTSDEIGEKLGYSGSQIERVQAMQRTLDSADANLLPYLRRIADKKSISAVTQLAKLPTEEAIDLAEIMLKDDRIKSVNKAIEFRDKQSNNERQSQVPIGDILAAIGRTAEINPNSIPKERVTLDLPVHLIGLGKAMAVAIEENDYDRALELLKALRDANKVPKKKSA